MSYDKFVSICGKKQPKNSMLQLSVLLEGSYSSVLLVRLWLSLRNLSF